MKVISEDSAYTLLYAKTQKKVNVSIRATVKCVSEIFRIKQDQIFLIQLLPGLNLFIKKREFLKWHGEIVPQLTYIFTELQPTTLNKGCKSHHLFYTVTKNSELLAGESVENVEEISVEEWLEHNDVDKDSVTLPENTDNTPHTDTGPKLVSYQGKVTRVLDEVLGVYELDNRVRLYVSTVPAVHKFTFMQEGVSLTLYNVHCKVSKELPKVRLYCCIFSIVRPDTESPVLTRRHFPDEELQKLLYLQGVTEPQLDWLYVTRKTLYETVEKVSRRRDTERVFSVLLSSQRLLWQQESSDSRNVLDKFLSAEHACCLNLENQSKVQTLPSFVSVSQLKQDIVNDETGSSASDDYWSLKKKKFVNDKILIAILRTNIQTGRPYLCDNSCCLDTVIGGYTPHLSCHSNCCCDTIQYGECFSCPYLQTCCVGNIVAINQYTVVIETFVVQGNQRPGPSTSAAYVTHKTGYIEFSLSDTVILGDTLKRIRPFMHDNKEKKDKTSSHNHVTVKFKEMDINTGTIDAAKDSELANFIPDKLHVPPEIENTEEFKEKILQDKKSEENKVTENVGLKSKSTLHRHVNKSGGSYFCRKENCLEQRDNRECVPVLCVKPVVQKRKSLGDHDKTNSKFLCVSKRRSIKQNEIDTSRTEANNTEADKGENMNGGLKAARKLVSEMGSKTDKFATDCTNLKSVFIEEWTENKCLVKVNSRESLVFESCTNNSVSLMFNVQGQIWKNGRFESEIVFIFKGKSVRWYPVLWPYTVFLFTISEEFSPLFKTGLSNSKVEQIIERSKVRKCLLVHPEVEINRVFEDTPNTEEVSKLVKISDLMDSSAEVPTKFVSFKGPIISRTYSDSEPVKGRMQKNFQQFSSLSDWGKFQISTPENRCVRLQVRDLESRSEVTVFMNLENTVYPLGLLPGAVVLFTRLEKKVSRLGNIYTRFVAISSVHILQISSSGLKLNQDMDLENVENKVIPKQRLVDLWQSKTAASEFECACDVLQIIKVSLKCVCNQCGSTVAGTDCQSAGCHMENGNKFIARASVIVDDGTSVAIVTQTGSGVQRLLGLSHDQWVCLEEEIRQHGEVFVQRNYPVYGTALEKFVYMLCDNRLVKKTWLMTLKTKQYNRSLDLNSLSLEDFVEKSVDTGMGSVKTRCLPFLQLECIKLQDFDPTAWAIYYMS